MEDRSEFISSSRLDALSKCWTTTQNILSFVQPSLSSIQRRRYIVDTIRELIRNHFGIELFQYGSVPLRTYIPVGDIDLTIITSQNVEDLATNICNLLELEGRKDTNFRVTKVQFIRAQVKIIKCIVQNIAVDISFNQMAGVYSVCFLEQMDQVIGRHHLFKESLILIKSWCYYESRILGAQHGLLSTYALETMVLYIINFFYSSVNGPLSVLYTFLAHFSIFDWDAYCVSINGPVPISSLPSVLVEISKKDEDAQFLCDEFLGICKDIFVAPTWLLDESENALQVKHLNIVDPLKDSNNLGRSINFGTFQRVKCALAYGAIKLEEILALPQESSMCEELKNFFVTTLKINGRVKGLDAQVTVSGRSSGKIEMSDLSGDYETSLDYLNYFQDHLTNTLLPSPTQFFNSSYDMQLYLDSYQMKTSILNLNEPLGFQNNQLLGSDYDFDELVGTSTNFCGMSVASETKIEILESNETPVNNVCTEETEKSQGSAWDSLDMINPSLENMHLCNEGQNEESLRSSDLLQNASENSDHQHQVEVASEMDKQTINLQHPDIHQPLSSKDHKGQPDGTKSSSSMPKNESPEKRACLQPFDLEDKDQFPSLSNSVTATKRWSKARR